MRRRIYARDDDLHDVAFQIAKQVGKVLTAALASDSMPTGEALQRRQDRLRQLGPFNALIGNDMSPDSASIETSSGSGERVASLRQPDFS